MTRIEVAPQVLDDFDRIFDHIAQFDIGSAPERITEIVEAVQVLVRSPMLGRPAKGGKRELVIGRDGRGYVALYRYVEQIDTVFVLAVRSQREVGYKR
jgi:toxin ParE1/3/4